MPEDLELPTPGMEYDLTEASMALQEAGDDATRHSDSRAVLSALLGARR
jgi:hypothetical protein